MTGPNGAGQPVPRPTAYRSRVLADVAALLKPLPPARRALDYGSGDGWFASEILRLKLAETVVGADIKLWPGLVRRPVIFDGSRLPFSDGAFDLTYAVDVLHHCPDPLAALDEVLRCTGRYFLIKDHSYRNVVGWSTLCVLDEIGNRRFRVPSVYRYQEGWTWDRHLTSRGFSLERRIHPAKCHVGPLGYLTNHLQFLALWRRN